MAAYKYKNSKGSVLWYANFYYTNWTGEKKRICKRGFKTQREAKEYERNFLEKQVGGSDITFQNLTDVYMEDKINRLKPTTIENKKTMLNKHIIPYFGNLKLMDINTQTIVKWQGEMKKQGFSETYLKVINNQLNAILNYACLHFGLKQNPCSAVGSIGKAKTAKEMQIWTQEQYEQFSQVIQRPDYKAAFDILFYGGLRLGELLALTPADFSDQKIRVNKNLVVVKGQQIIQSPKTAKSVRTIDIPEFLYAEVLDYINQCYGLRQDDRIFFFSKTGMTNAMANYAAKAGIEKIRLHDLRHSHVSLLINMGVDIKQIADRLGHESVKTTLDTYAHLYPDSGRKLANDLNNLIKR